MTFKILPELQHQHIIHSHNTRVEKGQEINVAMISERENMSVFIVDTETKELPAAHNQAGSMLELNWLNICK